MTSNVEIQDATSTTPEPSLTTIQDDDSKRGEIDKCAPISQDHVASMTLEPSSTMIQDDDERPNVLICGETGVGKSSIINMMAGRTVAQASNREHGCTSNAIPYDIEIEGTNFRVWDTAGLNEAEGGTVEEEQAEQQLVELIGNILQGKVALLVYCIRGNRLRRVVELNYKLIYHTACQERVPIVLIITGLENESPMESWWVDNEEDLNRRELKFKEHACITTTKGRRMADGTFLHEAEYKESENLIKRLVLGHHIPNNVIFSDVEEWRRSIRRGMQKHNMASGRSTRTNRGRLAGDKGWKAYGFDKAKRLKKSAVFAITELFSGCTSDSEPEGEDQTANTPPQNPLSPTDHPENAMRHANSLSGSAPGTHGSLPDTLNNHREPQYNPWGQQLDDREREEDTQDHRRASRTQSQTSIQHPSTPNSPQANPSLPSPLVATV